MMNYLSQYITGILRLSHILYGNDALSETYNKYILIIVHTFIKDTERLKNWGVQKVLSRMQLHAGCLSSH